MAANLSKLQRDAEEMMDSLRHDWRIIGDPSRPAQDREGCRLHVSYCLEQLEKIAGQIEAFDA